MRPENRFKRDDLDVPNTARVSTERNHTGKDPANETGADGEGSLYPPQSSVVSLWGADQARGIK